MRLLITLIYVKFYVPQQFLKLIKEGKGHAHARHTSSQVSTDQFELF